MDASSLVIIFDDDTEVAMNLSLIAGEIKEKELEGINSIEGLLDENTPKSTKNLPYVLSGIFLEYHGNGYQLRMSDGANKLITKEEAKTLKGAK